MTTTSCGPAAEDIATIASEVWDSFVSPDHQRGLDRAIRPLQDDLLLVSAAVNITGAWETLVALEMTADAARAAASAMLATDSVSPTDVADAVGELVNMIGGNVKSLVSPGGALGLPVVAEGVKRLRPPTGHHDVVCRVDLAWDGAPVRVSVWSRRNAEETREER